MKNQGSYNLNGAALMAEENTPQEKSVFKQILLLWRTWVVLLVPIILLPIPLIYTERSGRCAYAVLIMAIYWLTEALPMAITALLPLVLMPWLGVLGAKELAKNYLKDTNLLFFGGLIVAVAVEKWNLHKRIALRVLMLVGSKPRWLMFGFMSTTAFLSMWISNTATTAMMVPIAQAVLSELEAHRNSTKGRENPGFDAGEGDEEASPKSSWEVTKPPKVNDVPVKTATGNDVTGTEQVRLALDDTEEEENHNKMVASFEVAEREETPTVRTVPTKDTKDEKAFREMCKGLTLCVAYAANIGGTATLTGTGPNLVMKGQVDTLYGGQTGINFSSWFLYSFPNMLVTLLFAWFWLQILFLGLRATFSCCTKSKDVLQDEAVSAVIRNEYKKLGSFSFAEIAVLIHFIVLALLWLTREPEFIPGWASLFPEESKEYVTDATVAITISVSLFIFPSRLPKFLCFKSKTEEAGPVPALLDYPTMEKKMAWSVVLVLGGGFALANACQKSGLSADIGEAFNVFSNIPIWALVLILTATTAGFTEVTSNVATATIFLPILAQLAEAIGVNPLYLLVPTTVATSFAFMLPVATPPNAIVFAYGQIKIWDMCKAGIVMNIVSVLILSISINTWGYAYYSLGVYPDWANKTVAATAGPLIDLNSTLARNCSLLLGLGS